MTKTVTNSNGGQWIRVFTSRRVARFDVRRGHRNTHSIGHGQPVARILLLVYHRGHVPQLYFRGHWMVTKSYYQFSSWAFAMSSRARVQNHYHRCCNNCCYPIASLPELENQTRQPNVYWACLGETTILCLCLACDWSKFFVTSVICYCLHNT